MPNSEVKCSQTRKFAELPYIILHSTYIIPPGIRFFGNTPRAWWALGFGDFIYGRGCVGYTTNQPPAQLGRGGTPHEICRVAGLLGTLGKTFCYAKKCLHVMYMTKLIWLHNQGLLCSVVPPDPDHHPK